MSRSLSNQAVQHTAALNLEETKLKNYIELSSTLSRISNSAADAVAPKLAELISQRDRNKERLNSDFQDMGALWENIYNSFMQAVTGIIDNRLQNVMANLEKEPQAEAVNKSAASSSGTKRKEREFTISENVPPSKRTTSHEDFTHSKRRRVLTSGSVEEGELKPKAEVMEERFLRDMIVNDQVQRTEALAALSISNQVGRFVRSSVVALTCFFMFRNPKHQTLAHKALQTKPLARALSLDSTPIILSTNGTRMS